MGESEEMLILGEACIKKSVCVCVCVCVCMWAPVCSVARGMSEQVGP